MNTKILFLFLLLKLYCLHEISAQYTPIENPKVDIPDTRFFQYGGGITFLSPVEESFATIDFEIGNKRLISNFFALDFSLNYGVAFGDGDFFRAMQANAAYALLISPGGNDKEYIFRFGVGIVGTGVYDVSYFTDEQSGLFPGFCLVVENQIFRKKNNRFATIKLQFNQYTNNFSTFSISSIRNISRNKIKSDRQRMKNRS